MHTDAKDLALSVFQREQERSCERQRELEAEQQPPPPPPNEPSSTCDKGPRGSTAMKVYNMELIHLDLGIEELREKKDKIKKVMQLEEEEKANIQRELTTLTKRLAVIDASLSEKYAYVDEYDKTIQDVESAYSKILESSQALLHVLKTENSNQILQSAR